MLSKSNTKKSLEPFSEWIFRNKNTKEPLVFRKAVLLYQQTTFYQLNRCFAYAQ